ncbi:MAG: O-antigen ligase family protein [Candidatus Falkowbacteria bacterium]|nr:O-antigen ligase family protein [Candidatus Falkowbacteria bacterium]
MAKNISGPNDYHVNARGHFCSECRHHYFIYNKKTRIIILSLTILGGIILLGSPTIREPIISKITLQDLSGKIRQRQWTETMLMLKNGKLISGAGLSGYQAATKPYHQEGIFFNADKLPNFDDQLRNSAELRAKYWQPVEIYMYPHNILLNFWSELGLLGALLFAWIIIKYLYLSSKLFKVIKDKRTKIIALSLFAAMITIVIHGLVDVPYFKNDLSVMFWILIAILGILNLKAYENNRTQI